MMYIKSYSEWICCLSCGCDEVERNGLCLKCFRNETLDNILSEEKIHEQTPYSKDSQLSN